MRRNTGPIGVHPVNFSACSSPYATNTAQSLVGPGFGRIGSPTPSLCLPAAPLQFLAIMFRASGTKANDVVRGDILMMRRKWGMPRVSSVLSAVIVGVLSIATAHAGTIGGPTLNTADSGWNYSGIGFTATVNATLTSFTFQNQGQADTVILVDPLGNILDSVAIPASTPSDTVLVNWALTSGNQYYLLQSTLSNSFYTSWGAAAPSDAEIALTDTGVFSQSPVSANFGLGGAGGSGTVTWAAFNDITTSSSSGAVPEPASLTLLLPGALAIFWRAKRKGIVR
jgi:hypothetical protein